MFYTWLCFLLRWSSVLLYFSGFFKRMKLYDLLENISARPEPFAFYTAEDLWTDEHTSKHMLSYHLNQDIDVSSRNAKFIDRSVNWITSHFKVGKNVKIADFGCGPGLYTTRLARKKADVTGIDFSKRSIQHARAVAAKNKLRIQYEKQNYLEFETDERFDLVMMIMCDFCALSRQQRQIMLQKFHSMLAGRGSILLDVYSLNSFDQQEEISVFEENLLNGFWSPKKYYGFLNRFKYNREKVILEKYTIIEADQIRTCYNWMQYFSPEDLEKEFAESGLKVEEIYADVAGTAYNFESAEFAIVARAV